MLLKIIVLAAIAVASTNAEQASGALNAFARSEIGDAITAYRNDPYVSFGWGEFHRISMDNHVTLDRYLHSIPTHRNRLLTSSEFRNFLQREINNKKNFFHNLNDNWTNWAQSNGIYVSAAISSLTNFLNLIRDSQDFSAVLGLTFDMLSITNQYRKENLAVVAFYNGKVAALRTFSSEFGSLGMLQASENYFNTLEALYYTLLGDM